MREVLELPTLQRMAFQKTIPIAEGAERLGITSERLRVLCVQRRVPGARLLGARWRVPANLALKHIIPAGRGSKLGSGR